MLGLGGGQTVANPGHKEAKSSIPAERGGEGERGRTRERGKGRGTGTGKRKGRGTSRGEGGEGKGERGRGREGGDVDKKSGTPHSPSGN